MATEKMLRVVVGYELGALPGDWLQVWRRLARAVERSRLAATVSLDPLDDLHEDVAYLVVPIGLEARARELAGPSVSIRTAPPTADASVLEAIIAELRERAPLRQAEDPESTPNLVTYRGSQRID